MVSDMDPRRRFPLVIIACFCSVFIDGSWLLGTEGPYDVAGRATASTLLQQAVEVDAYKRRNANPRRSTTPAVATPDSVALIVRSYAGDAAVLRLLLQSVELFWPNQWEVVVVLDAESLADRNLARDLPTWVRVEFEEPPPHFELYLPLRKQTSSGERHTTGYTRGQYSAFYSDRYSDAEYIAVADSDIAFVTSAVHLALFRNGLPMVLGTCGVGNGTDIHQYHLAMSALGIEQFAQFMFVLPFLMRRRDFAALRSYISEHMRTSNLADVPAPFPASPQLARKAFEERGADVYFPEAFVDMQNSIARRAFAIYGANTYTAASGQMLPSFEAIAGSFLWKQRRALYAWSLRGCHMAPPITRCATLCAANHYTSMDYGVPKAHKRILSLGHEAIQRGRCAFGEGAMALDATEENRSACTDKARELWALDLLYCSGVGSEEANVYPDEHAKTLWPKRGSACERYGAPALLAEQRSFLRRHQPVPRRLF
eukprot:TRINITY_DN56816_c0_g1_i1.p1 TRINITY_DN56816_c0_g1~~TRINITY_DN56816_c0_g1_i1.p1  ORF type:complete len:503 (+),score=63.66 TRINITY_DN56816_c0_g1_i1:57-1511(+)